MRSKTPVAKQIIESLSKEANPERAVFVARFFQAFPGGYGEGDKFLGLPVPAQRRIAKKYYKCISLAEVKQLLKNAYHECRFTALVILTHRYQIAKTTEAQKTYIDTYLAHMDYINNWDLVDITASKLLGNYLIDKNRDMLYQLAHTSHLWRQRVAIVATYYFIQQHEYQDTFALAEHFLAHPHDLIHKATGWMLREVGKKAESKLLGFLDTYHHAMPRTMLRYAIERLTPALRKHYMQH